MRSVVVWLMSLALFAADEVVILSTPHGERAADCIYRGSRPEWIAGDRLISVDGSQVTAVDARTGREVWRSHEPAKRPLRALAQSGQRLFMARLPQQMKDGWSFDGCGEVLVLDLASGSWLASLAPPPAADHQLLVDAVVEANGQQIIAWHRWAEIDHSWRQEEIIVSATSGKATKWTRRWPCQAPMPAPGAFLLGGQQPVAVGETVVPLQPWGDALIVCPGPTSAVQVIAQADGVDRWSIERLWEFERDFIGPSVWCHELRRFGRNEVDEAWRRAGTKTINVTPEDKAAVDAQVPGVVADWRKDFAAHSTAWLAGGPWLVPRPSRGGNQLADAILVAVAIAPVHAFARNLARVRLYDLGASGAPVALAELPRAPHLAQVVGGQLIFASSPTGIGAIRPFPWDGPQGGMGGGPDCLLSLAWYAEPERVRADAWLQGRWVPPPALSPRFAALPCDGGYIQREDDRLLRAGFDLVTLPGGERERYSVHIPIGDVPLPQNNYEKFTRADGSLGTVTYQVVSSDAPTSYRIIGDRLIVTLGEAQQAVFTLNRP